MKTTREQLAELAERYRALESLRREAEDAAARGLLAFPPAEAPARRAAMKRLAARFPGALRDLEQTPASELGARADALERALSTGSAEPWMRAAALYQAALREALAIRRGSLAPLEFWAEPRFGDGDRAQLARPPTGRLLDLVWGAVASELGLTPREAELLVYPRAPVRGTRT